MSSASWSCASSSSIFSCWAWDVISASLFWKQKKKKKKSNPFVLYFKEIYQQHTILIEKSGNRCERSICKRSM
ncbi:hypothetical protein HanRHA438_Chr02g0064521 [Helianthus annuus]|nr:hypothetical protein HanRHA438_Chr02g0064481 [Helianthus annuus]KAJ0939730.1 hypothetical protein HanRHA438_Chr02g0064521 [Helianthus annuus]